MTDGTPRKRLKAPERRASILQAARGVFLESGLAGTRTRELAQAAGINEAVLYSHFGSKEELFEAAVVEQLEAIILGLVDRTKASRELDTDPATEFAELTTYILTQMKDIVPLLGVALFTDQSAGKQLYQQRIMPLLQQWIELSGKSLGRLPDQPTLDTEFIFEAFFGMMFGFALNSLFLEEELDVERVAGGVRTLMLYGMSAPQPAGAKPAAKGRTAKSTGRRPNSRALNPAS